MIPSIATAPALIIVGIFMISQLSSLDLSDLTVAVPGFYGSCNYAFTFNIAYGVLFSMLGYTLCMVAAGRKKELSPTMIVLTGVFIAYFILDCIFKERGKRC